MTAFEPCSLVAGPGLRAVVWVAGCLRRCPGCFNPEYFSFAAGHDVYVEEVLDRILALDEIEGVTFSGGEPFEQAQALARLAGSVRNAGLSVAAYSGYTLASLRAQPDRFADLLSQVDLLIAGEYRRELPGPLTWRGSANQTLHYLTGRLSPFDIQSPISEITEVQLTVTDRGIRLTGFPSKAFESALRSNLLARGVVLHGAGQHK